MKCPRCAADNPAGSNFCASCGGPTREQPATTGAAGYGQTPLTSASQPAGQDFPARPDSGGWGPPPVHQGQAGQPHGSWGQPAAGPGYAPAAGAAPSSPQPQQPQPYQPQSYQPQPYPAGGSPGGPTRPGGGHGLSLAAGVAALAGAGLVIWACALPYLRYASSGTSVSIFHSGSPSGSWFAAEPVGVAIVVAVAAVLLMTIARAPALRWVTSGMLAGFGIQTVLLFAGYRYGISGDGIHAGSAAATGAAGGIILLVAGLIGMFSAASSRSAPG